MTTNYDPIAEQYQRSKLQPWRAHIETYTLMGLLGELSGKSVLDVACGEGFYTRLLRGVGAERVVGVDLSPGMIALARSQESVAPLGIDYAVGEATLLGRGLGTELVAALVKVVRTAHPGCGVVADPDERNIPSRRVLEKNGFELMRIAALDSEPTNDPVAIYRLAV